VEREGLQADDDALRIVARRAAGSMRDSQSLLDQLLSSATGKLTAEHVNAVLGTAGDDRVIELVNAVLASNAAVALELIESWVEHGLQVGELVDQFIEYWRAMMLVNCGGKIRELPVSPNQAEAVQTHAKALSLDAILAGLELLTATKTRMRGSSHTQVLLEMAILRLCRLSDLLSVSQLVQTITQSGAPSVTVARSVSKTAAPAPPANENVKKNLAVSEKPGSNEVITTESATLALTEATLPEVWKRFLQYVFEKLPFLAKHLKHASSYATFGPNSLVIRFPLGYNEAQTECSGESGLARIQDALRRVTGQTVAVRIERDANAKAAAPVATAAAPQPDKKRSLASLPLFKKASEVLGAQIWHVDEDFNPDALPKTGNNSSEQPTDSDEE
jgi:DNA polymerase-3 subunit gamma/tau